MKKDSLEIDQLESRSSGSSSFLSLTKAIIYANLCAGCSMIFENFRIV